MKLSPRANSAPLWAAATRQAVAASLLSAALLVGGPAIAEDEQTSADFKMLGGGASTLQSGRRITITRGVNLDNTDWKGENLKGVAFQQSVVRKANFDKANLFSASFFDADLAGSTFVGANMQQCNLEMADLTNADLTNADLTQAYTTGFVIQDLKKIENTDWSEVDMRKDQRKYLCGLESAKGKNPTTGIETRDSLACPD